MSNSETSDQSITVEAKEPFVLETEEMHLKCCTILIVDDSEDDRFTYQRFLAQADMGKYSVLESDCGEAGLALCQEECPDVILLDYLLPDCDGLEFVQTLQEKLPSLPPIIMLTGQGNEQVAVEAMKMGVKDYLVKRSLTPEQMAQAIQRVLADQALRRVLHRQQRQQHLMTNLSLRISQSLKLNTILQTAVDGALQLLECDRTLIYQFESDMTGTVVAEAIVPGWTSSLGRNIEDTCFQTTGATRYLAGHKTVIPDIHTSNLTPCHIELLEQFQVKANIVVPIVLNQTISGERPKLWGLLIAHHCRSPKDWQANELSLMDNLAIQLAIAIQQSTLVSDLAVRAKALKKSNRKLVKATQLLKTRNKELDEFAYIASHDMRAPLRAIANLATWLNEDLDGQIPEENQQQLTLMQSRVKRLDQFIQGLLSYSRSGRQGLEVEEIDTSILVNSILTNIDVPPAFTVTVPQLPTLVTRKLLLEQVLTNLISNAIKYHDRPDGQITISVEDLGDTVQFAIADDGPGIDPQYHDRIFGIFQTIGQPDQTESSGIGLSIVKKLVIQQGGDITLQSAIGEGSTFSFTWPKQSQ